MHHDASPGPARFETGLRQPGRGSYGSVHHVSQRRARRACSCEHAHSASDLEFATLPPRLGVRRRFAPKVSPFSAIRSMQRSGFPRRCTFRLRRRRSTSAATSIVGTSPSRTSSSLYPFCRAGARQSHRSPCGEQRNAGRCRTPGSRAAWSPMLHPTSLSTTPDSKRRFATALGAWTASRARLDGRLSTIAALLRGSTASSGGIRRDVGSSPCSKSVEHLSSPRTPTPWDGDPTRRLLAPSPCDDDPSTSSIEARRRRVPREGPRL
jgi:hypothetical protein